MSKYTTEVSNMLAAYASLVNYYGDERQITIKSIEYNCKRSPLDVFKNADFDYYQKTTANALVQKYGAAFIRNDCKNIVQNFTDQDDINTQIMDQFLRTFVRHFYNYEIGQENIEDWWLLLQGYLDEYMPFFVLSYQQLILKNQAFITGLSDSHTHNNATGNVGGNSQTAGIAAAADTPQKDLNFKLKTGDPTDDYNFDYSSDVQGNKGTTKSTSDSKSNSDTTNHTESRNQTVMALIQQLNMFSNGLYLELFQQAKNYGLFMQVLA